MQHASRPANHMRRQALHAGQRLVIWPKDPSQAFKVAEEALRHVTKRVSQLMDAVPMTKPGVPAAYEHPVFTPGHTAVLQP